MTVNMEHKGKKTRSERQKNEAEGEHCVRKQISKFTEFT